MNSKEKALVKQYREQQRASLDPFTDEQIFEMYKDSLVWAAMVFDNELRRLYAVVGEEFETSAGGRAVRRLKRVLKQ